MAAAPAATAPSTEPSPPPPAAPAATGLLAKILKQGKPAAHVPSAKPVLGKPGKYRVTHGDLTLGYDDKGDRVVAHPGAIVELSALEAGPLVLSETVELCE